MCNSFTKGVNDFISSRKLLVSSTFNCSDLRENENRFQIQMLNTP